MDAGQAQICVYSKATPFQPKRYDLPLNFQTHTALLPSSQVPQGMYNPPLPGVLKSLGLWSQMDLSLSPDSTCATRSEQLLFSLCHSFLICEMGI